MIILDKWYPMVQPTRNNITTLAFEQAVEKVQEEYKQALKAHKVSLANHEIDVDLYNKRGRQNTIELEMFANRRRFQIFV
jgi:hypothetical protein